MTQRFLLYLDKSLDTLSRILSTTYQFYSMHSIQHHIQHTPFPTKNVEIRSTALPFLFQSCSVSAGFSLSMTHVIHRNSTALMIIRYFVFLVQRIIVQAYSFNENHRIWMLHLQRSQETMKHVNTVVFNGLNPSKGFKK